MVEGAVGLGQPPLHEVTVTVDVVRVVETQVELLLLYVLVTGQVVRVV